VGELPSLRAEHLPSFASTEALWYRVFDLLGWEYLRRGSSTIANVEERRRGMEILQLCYKLPAIQKLVDPVERVELTKYNHDEYWSQYCDSAEDGQWMINHDRPNHLFLLLRDIPCPSQFSSQEIDVTARLSQWRNQTKKDPQAWDEVFSDVTSLSSEFFGACVITFGNFCRRKIWAMERRDLRELYTSIARKIVQIAAQRQDLLAHATVLLIRTYESLLAGYGIASRSSSCITMPIEYGNALEQGSAEDHTTHAYLTLLLSIQIPSDGEPESASRVKDVIAMLWLRSSNPVPRDWGHLLETHRRDIPGDIISDWIRNAESVPHILEILRHLAQAQESNPAIGPLWRSIAHEVMDPHFVEALQCFDRLMGMDCAEDDHYVLVNLVCQDLEMEPFVDLDHYFTSGRVESLALLKDDCLRILVMCARGPEFLSPVCVPEAYGKSRRESLARVAEYVCKRVSSVDSPAALQLQASLWPMALETDLYANILLDGPRFVSSYQAPIEWYLTETRTSCSVCLSTQYPVANALMVLVIWFLIYSVSQTTLRSIKTLCFLAKFH
jgi:hypothetical protein